MPKIVSPREHCRRPCTKPVTFRTAKDPAVMAIAKMVVAGVDKKHEIHPDYPVLVRSYGTAEAHRLIESAVALAGACDIIQTDIEHGGIGLFGGLAGNSTRFNFYEWLGGECGTLSVSMTKQEARDIVSGKKKTIIFKPVRFRARLCIDLKRRSFFTKDVGVWAFPCTDPMVEGMPAHPDKFRVVIGGKSFHLEVSRVVLPYMTAHDERRHIYLEVPPTTRAWMREALLSDRGWKTRSHRSVA